MVRMKPACSQKSRTFGHTASGGAFTTSQRLSSLRSMCKFSGCASTPPRPAPAAPGASRPAAYSERVVVPPSGTTRASSMVALLRSGGISSDGSTRLCL